MLYDYKLGYDDALDAFGVHAIGGIFGGLGTAFFVTDSVTESKLINGIFYTHGLKNSNIGGKIFAVQLCGVVFSIGWSFFFTYLILFCIDWLIGIRVSEEDEVVGLDVSIHNECNDYEKMIRVDGIIPYSLHSKVGITQDTAAALKIESLEHQEMKEMMGVSGNEGTGVSELNGNMSKPSKRMIVITEELV